MSFNKQFHRINLSDVNARNKNNKHILIMVNLFFKKKDDKSPVVKPQVVKSQVDKKKIVKQPVDKKKIVKNKVVEKKDTMVIPPPRKSLTKYDTTLKNNNLKEPSYNLKTPSNNLVPVLNNTTVEMI
jgi:hypothetical protein